MGPKAVVRWSQACKQTICQEHLHSHVREGDAFLHRIVTGDESWCTIMNHIVRDNQCSGSTSRLRPTKNLRHRLPLGKSCWPSLGMSMALYWCIFRKKWVKLRLVLDTHASERVEARDTIETPGTSLKKSTVASRQRTSQPMGSLSCQQQPRRHPHGSRV